jgi:ketosteroid isomerase-like protein
MFQGGHHAGRARVMDRFVTTSTWAALVALTIFTAGRNDMAAYMKFYAPKAVMVLPGRPITGLAAPFGKSFAPGYKLKMVTTKAEVSATGDFSYTYGTWGAIADTYNVDPPP